MLYYYVHTYINKKQTKYRIQSIINFSAKRQLVNYFLLLRDSGKRIPDKKPVLIIQ